MRFACSSTAAPDADAAKLAPREKETLTNLLRGLSDKEIASEMDLSPHTVRQYLKRIFRVYGVNSRAQLISLILGTHGRSARR